MTRLDLAAQRRARVIQEANRHLVRNIVIAAIGCGLLVAAVAIAASQKAHAEIRCGRFGCSDQLSRHVAKRQRRHRYSRRSVRRAPVDANGNGVGLITVDTAANIKITVAPGFATKMQGFIADVVAHGYHPHQIHCYARGGHVPGSLHYRGEACDFDQRGWGLTARAMYHVGAIARAHGLRDGCAFRDCGHIDSGHALARHPWSRTVAAFGQVQ